MLTTNFCLISWIGDEKIAFPQNVAISSYKVASQIKPCVESDFYKISILNKNMFLDLDDMKVR